MLHCACVSRAIIKQAISISIKVIIFIQRIFYVGLLKIRNKNLQMYYLMCLTTTNRCTHTG